MKVSICCITYNHQNFIRHALDGFQKQKTDFEVEIIISDDASADDTLQIIESYAANDSSIKVLKNEKNIGMMPNFIKALQACTGNYIALCEGDDFWIDEYKLQKQIDFLEANKDFSISFHRAKLVYENGLPENYADINVKTPTVTDLHDIVKGNYIHTPTCVFRKNFLGFPNWFVKVPTGDWALHILNAQYGKIHFIDDEMAAYRIHSAGVLSTKRELSTDLKKMEMYKDLSEYFKNQDLAVHRHFKKLHYSQKAHYLGVQNVNRKGVFSRMMLLVRCGWNIKSFKYIFGSFLVPFFPGQQLSQLWEAASKKKSSFSLQ